MHNAQGMSKPWDLKERTMLFALNILRFCRGLPRTDEAAEIASQPRRAGGSTGAQYRAATRTKSESDYINKIAGAIEECDESLFLLELLARARIAQRNDIQPPL
jgi:four helix bundle protein